MQINELMHKFVTDLQADNSVSKKTWATSHLARLDDVSTSILALEGLIARLAKKARNTRMEIGQHASNLQQDLPFDLPFAVSIDPSETTIKATARLTRAEMDRAIDIRQKQVRADQLRLSEFMAAKRAADPYWDKNPDWTFGECIEAYLSPAANDNVPEKVAA